MARATFICNPGEPRHLSELDRAEMCRCGHIRNEHWWGGGPCGDCGDRNRPCEYFRPKKVAR